MRPFNGFVFVLLPALALAQSPTKESALPSLAPLVESIKGAVVNVDVQAHKGPGMEMDEESMERFFGRGPRREQLAKGMGSGFVIDPKGLVLTNNHVVEGAVSIRVRFDDGRSFDGEVLGRDPLTDVALVKLKGKFDALPTVKLGDSAQMKVGDFVVAIGNPLGLASSVSLGIVSALDRNIHAGPYDQFLQTDAAINPGNSGGPLFNLKGEVIGINTAITSVGSGIGFAVPSNVARALVPQLEKTGTVVRGWLGVGIQDLSGALAKGMGLPVQDGAVITQVNPGSPAAAAGIQEEDVVVAVDGEKVVSSAGLSRAIALKRPESLITLSAYRAGKPLELKLKVGTRPDLENVAARSPEPSSPSTGKQQRFGISYQDMDPRLSEGLGLPQRGALVVEVAPGSPAERAGLARGMAVVEINKKPVRGRDDLARLLGEAKSGTVALLRAAVPGGNNRALIALEVP